MCLSSAHSKAVIQDNPKANHYRYEDRLFRYQSLVFLWPTVSGEIKPRTSISISASKVFSRALRNTIQTSDIVIVDPDGESLDYALIRDGRSISEPSTIGSSDDLLINMRLDIGNKDACGVAVILFGDASRRKRDKPTRIEAMDPRDAISDDSANPNVGIVDYTGPIDLGNPAALIQMDSIFSARWNLWYEFAHHPEKKAGKSLVAIPVNPLFLSSMQGGNSTCFNMDDVPRFPLYYLRYFKATGDKSVLGKARIGLETILFYTRDNGTMPYLISPWDGKHRPGSDLFDIYHSMRTVSEAIPVFTNDKAFTKRLISAYESYRSFVFSHLYNGLFQDRASANGAVLEAVYNRWKSTGNDREVDDIRKLADALCTDYARMQRSDFGEYIPWVLIGLTCAFKATGDTKYSDEAYEWLTTTVIPSLRLDRRYYYSVPNFKLSGIGEGLTANPLQIWYHTDALLQMYDIGHDERLLKLAAWVFGDYYDAKRYSSVPSAFIVDTGDPYTERWGSASAEDALRMMAKYLWQTQYPTLFEESRRNADTSSACPWIDVPDSSSMHVRRSEISFDDGNSNLSTVIGLYKNNGLNYHQVQDFTITDVDRVSDAKAALHVHVGSRIAPASGNTESKIGISVNGNPWRWLKLNLYMDDANHWLEIPVPISELHDGINRIETDSTIGSQGNMTSESLDMFASGMGEIHERSLHTHDLVTYQRLMDRNWGIRLRYNEMAYKKSDIKTLNIRPSRGSVPIGDSLQLSVEGHEADGRITHPSDVTWSARYGRIDKYGLYHPTINGVDEISASLGGKTLKSMIDVNTSVPFGVEPPGGRKRLKYFVPDGHISLTGEWDFMPDPKDAGIDKKWYMSEERKWSEIHVPGSWQAQGFGLDFHGIGWYRKGVTIPAKWNGRRIWARFDGAATSAKVWVNGEYVGEHTGNWSPFELDITKYVSADGPNSITVRLEELPNHFSAGFPLIVGMHYGGIWQPVTIYATDSIHIDDVFIHPMLSKKVIEVEVTTSSTSATYGFIDYRITASNKKTTVDGQMAIDPSGITKVSIPISDPVAWSPESPALYHASIRVIEGISKPSKKVLVIGAERHIVRLIEVNLEHQGYEIITVNNQDGVLQKVEEENPDLIVLDVMMPHMDSSEIIRNLRHNPDTRDIPLITLTSKAQDASVFQGWQSGIELITDKPLNVLRGKVSDERELSFGMRDVETRDGKLLLNGKPIFVRGSLHWGFYPELISIVPNEKQIRKEFTDLKKAGFNLVKVCMFTFPKRFYEIADEMGMLIWQEYPLWLTFPKSDDAGPHDNIIREYREWFKYDRNHPSVILRDLTCEAVDMNQELTRTIYNMAKTMTGNALIEDNSAYLNTPLSDFHDGHFYWELDAHYQNVGGWAIPGIRGITPLKPFIGGEDFDMDTYRDMPAIRREFIKGGVVPWWLNNSNFKLQETMEKDIINRDYPDLSSELIGKQRLHSIATRKALIEEYRRFPEIAGYVVTHIRDNPLTRPGFYDDLGNPKWKPETWRRFTGDRVMILHSERRSFCFKSDKVAKLNIMLSNYGDALHDVPLKWRILDDRKIIMQGEASISQEGGDISSVIGCELPCSSLESKLPERLRFIAELGDKGRYSKNEWPIWVFPAGGMTRLGNRILKHGSKSFLSSLPEYEDSKESSPMTADDNTLIVTDTLDKWVIEALVNGTRVLYTAGDEAIPRRDAPFWREIAVVFPKGDSALGDFPHDGFIDRHFLDLTQRRPFDTSEFRDGITPILWGVNARFTDPMPIDYIFEARVDKGRLLACCLNVAGDDNIAGEYLLKQMIQYASGDLFNPADKGNKKLSDLIYLTMQGKK